MLGQLERTGCRTVCRRQCPKRGLILGKDNKDSNPEMDSCNILENKDENITHYKGFGARKILLDMPIEGFGFSYVAIEKDKLKILTERVDCFEEDLLPLPGRVVDRLQFLRTETENDDPLFVGFLFLICKSIGRQLNTFLVVSVRLINGNKWKLEFTCMVPTVCSKIAHVFCDQWQIPEKIMLMRPDKTSFDVLSTDGDELGTFDFETECLPDRCISVEKTFFMASRSGFSQWSLDRSEVKIVKDLPVKVDFDKAFAQKCRSSPQAPDDQSFYTGESVYFLYNGESVEVEDAKDIVGYNFVITEKGLFFIDGWPDDELKLRRVTQKKLKPLLFDWVERHETPFRAFFVDEDTNELIVFSESDNLEITKISDIRGKILDVSVNFKHDTFKVYTMEEAIEVSDFESLPKRNVEFIP